MTEDVADIIQPLSILAEDEQLFRDSVREFAEAQIRPLVREMDEQAKIPRALIDKLFDLGVMGIEIPEAFGGAGGRFFHSVLAVEEISRVDPVDRRAGRRPEHARRSTRCCASATTTSSAAGCPGWRPARSAPTRCRKPVPAATPSR